MIKRLKNYFSKLGARLLDEEEHRKIIHLYTFAILSIVSFVMTVINIITQEVALGIATGLFALLTAVNFVLQKYFAKTRKVTSVLFAVEFFALLIFFIVAGNPGGFSILWIVLVPFLSMLFYGTKRGIYFSLACFAILVFFLWIPFGQELVQSEAIYSVAHSRVCQSDTHYSAIFRLRFPFLYLSVTALALILETIKAYAYKQIILQKEENEFLSQHDPLTSLYNRLGYRRVINENLEKANDVAILICDINKFKTFNDTYGHLFGDYVLTEFASLMKEHLSSFSCRYGGDEFSCVFFDNPDPRKALETFNDIVKDHKFEFNGVAINVTISFGLYITDKDEMKTLDQCLKKADNNLYKAKADSVNNIVVSRN